MMFVSHLLASSMNVCFSSSSRVWSEPRFSSLFGEPAWLGSLVPTSLIWEAQLVFTHTRSSSGSSLAQPQLFLPICVAAGVASSAFFYVAAEHHSYYAVFSRFCYNYNAFMHEQCICWLSMRSGIV